MLFSAGDAARAATANDDGIDEDEDNDEETDDCEDDEDVTS